MKVLRVYLENSVIEAYFNEEFREHTKKLFEEFEGYYKRNFFPCNNRMNDDAHYHVK